MPSSIFSRLNHPPSDLRHQFLLILCISGTSGIHSTVKIRLGECLSVPSNTALSPGPYTKLLSCSFKTLSAGYDNVHPCLPTCCLSDCFECIYVFLCFLAFRLHRLWGCIPSRPTPSQASKFIHAIQILTL